MDSKGRPSLGGERSDGVDLDPTAVVAEAGAVGGKCERESQSGCGLNCCCGVKREA